VVDSDADTGVGVRSVLRACSLLSAFSFEQPRLALAELASAVRLPKPTTYRIAASLVSAGYMMQGEDGRYELGPKLLEGGAIVRSNLNPMRACSVAAGALAETTGETVLVAQFDWATAEVTIVDRRDSQHALSVLSPVGRRSKAPPGCLTKALLSGVSAAECETLLERVEFRDLASAPQSDAATLLSEIELARDTGFAVEQNEYIDGVSGVGVPVLSDGLRPTAALAVVGPSSRLGESDLRRIGALMLDLCRAL
jgi:DNA-binding IclR family transcriptional regulator